MDDREVVSLSTPERAARLPLSALMSQILVAFTLEFDNEYESRMNRSGAGGSALSYAVWALVIRYIDENGLTVRDLSTASHLPERGGKFLLGCLERWGYISFDIGSLDNKRDGWGSGRGIRAPWTVRLTSAGLKARSTWGPLHSEIEARWSARYSPNAILKLRQSLVIVVNKLELDLPCAVISGWSEIATPSKGPRGTGKESQPILTLLSKLLLAFSTDFDRQADAPIELSANTLRVSSVHPMSESEIPRRTGCSPETAGVGWQIKPYVIVEPDSSRRGKTVRLSEKGIVAREHYHALVWIIEQNWAQKYGSKEIDDLRFSLLALYGDGDLLATTLTPSPGTARSGTFLPALGRRDVGPAAKQRIADMAEQTRTFIADPVGSLPHYPMLDMNRAFGP